MRTARLPATSLVTALALLAAATGCGAADDDPGPATGSDPAVAGGSFTLTDWTADGRAVPVVGAVRLVLDPAFGSAILETDCGDQFGAYTLLADGRAGVTLAGGRPSPCSDAAAEQEERLVAALGSVERWDADGSVLTLDGPDTSFSLARA